MKKVEKGVKQGKVCETRKKRGNKGKKRRRGRKKGQRGNK